MFQFDFGSIVQSSRPSASSAVAAASISQIAWTFWEEHCLECAQPECYLSCPLFIRRADANCARFDGGIRSHRGYDGPSGQGAEILFRKWGKLQSVVSRRAVDVNTYRTFQRLDGALARATVAADLVSPWCGHPRSLKPQSYYSAIRRRWIDGQVAKAPVFDPEEFLLEAWNLGKTDFQLCLELRRGDALVHRESFRLEPGHNLARSNAAAAALPDDGERVLAMLFPENDHPAHVVLTWLDFVRYRTAARAQACPEPSGSAQKVKCVVWDLDNTLWSGIVGDDGVDAVTPLPESVQLVKQLDARGILQSIASKNDPDVASEALRRHGLLEYFLHPEIHWNPKSASLQNIAANLNIGIDSLAFIDDSAFERGEVRESLPAVRLYDVHDIPRIAALEPFDVPITSESVRRRSLYMVDAERRVAFETHGSDLTAFLRRCGMTLRIQSTFDDASLDRCAEILQRTNQLNLSGRRLSRQAIAEMIATEHMRCFGLHCSDMFGEYGLVGFAATVIKGNTCVLTDLAISCRVAGKKIENALTSYLQKVARRQGLERVEADYVATARNGILLASLEAAGFVSDAQLAGRLVLHTDVAIADADVVNLAVEVGST